MSTRREEAEEDADKKVEEVVRGTAMLSLRGIERATRLDTRVVDRSLQRLRKRGQIRFRRELGGWEFVGKEETHGSRE